MSNYNNDSTAVHSENREAIAALFELSEKAKNIGFHKLANIVFAILVEEPRFRNYLTVSLETADFDGEELASAYWDLAVLEHDDKYYACIPLPLLSQEGVAYFLKGMLYKDRGDHSGRAVIQGCKKEKEALVYELVSIFNRHSSLTPHFYEYRLLSRKVNRKSKKLRKKIYAIYYGDTK